MSIQYRSRASDRPGIAATEFAIVCPIFFLIFLGMVDIGRGMMVVGAVSNAARIGARAAGVTGGNYSSATDAVATALSDARLPSTTPPTITVNGVAVTDDASFQAAAVPGATVAVQVSLTYGSVSWLPGGASLFVGSSQPLSATCSMTKEG